MPKKRYLRMDNAKGILIILVVLGHFLLFLQGKTKLCTNFFYEIYAFHMPAFTFLSGIFSQGIFAKEKGGYSFWHLSKVLWLYVIYEIIVFFSEIPAYGMTTMIPDFFSESGAPWYLLALFFWYMGIPLVDCFGRKDIAWLAVLVSALAGGYISGLEDFLSLNRVIAFAPFFYAGHIVGPERLENFLKGRDVSIKANVVRYITLGIAVITVVIIGGFMYDYFLPYHDAMFGVSYERFRVHENQLSFPGILSDNVWILRLIWYMTSGALTLTFLRLLPDKELPLITKMGQRTLQIYILHRPVRDLMLAFGLITWGDPENPFILIAVILFCVALSVVLSMPVFTKLFNLILFPFRKKQKYTI
ncbi:acyltransferase family protein [Oribacterium sp. WCC10]|uniref:acyltransferase family protein n=1 Tax=Oribacterium sp. WCC10 TaxID=1855343 RepID=UPI0008E4DAB0|nr:acyltransferase family protein [Oribacterium sp. WCC10]SFG14301.1 Fucose 4-O-acetylase [Oribacterium sp. WCC10]